MFIILCKTVVGYILSSSLSIYSSDVKETIQIVAMGSDLLQFP